DGNGNAVSVFAMDSLVFVQVRDTGQNLSGALIENVSATVFDTNTGDSETLVLTELAADSGIFRNTTGLPLSDTIGVRINDGILFTGQVFAITARYVDAVTPFDSSTDTAGIARSPRNSSLAFDRSSYAPETRVVVIVTDPDRNRNPLVLDSFSVSLVSETRNDTESVLVTETSETSGVFSNAAGARISDTTGFASNDGALLVALGDTFTAVYVDAVDPTDSASALASVDTLAKAGTVAFDRDSYLQTDSVVITVFDRDRNLDPRGKDTLGVAVQNPRTGDSESLLLTETDSTSLTFTSNALVFTDTGVVVPGDGKFFASNSDTIEVLYADPLPVTVESDTAQMGITPSQGSIRFDRTNYTVFDTLQVIVHDMDRNTDPYAAETITLRRLLVSDPTGAAVENNFEVFTLVETTETSAIFTLPAPLLLSDTAFPAVVGDTVLTAGLNFTIQAEYRDPVFLDFASDSVLTIDSPMTSQVLFDRALYPLAETAFVTVVDRDENRHPGVRDTITVTVTNTNTGETEERLLRETSSTSFTFVDDTGLFLSSLLSDSLSGDGRLYVMIGNTIRVDYQDPNTPADAPFSTALIDTIPPSAGMITLVDSA
ncbi:MAG: hypothetical protein D6679_01865, partial [Candidatus Hydrogenedentota bacterium]